MVGILKKYGGERVAAALAMEDGLDWASLTPEQKEFYYSKAYQKKQDNQTTRKPEDRSGKKKRSW